MHYVYIIYSSKSDKYYIGSTDDISGRIRRHNSNHKGFTGHANDWCLKYTETFQDKSNALAREKAIKNWKSRTMIEKRIALKETEHPD